LFKGELYFEKRPVWQTEREEWHSHAHLFPSYTQLHWGGLNKEWGENTQKCNLLFSMEAGATGRKGFAEPPGAHEHRHHQTWISEF